METPAPPNALVRPPSPNPTPIPPTGPGSQRPNRLEKHVPRSRWYTDQDPIADERRREEARQLREAHEAESSAPGLQHDYAALLHAIDAPPARRRGAPNG